MLRRLGRLAAGFVSGFLILSLALVMLYRQVPPPATPLMLLRLAEGYGLRKSWRPLDQISPALIRAVIASEDQRFCLHHGFDWKAMETAWEQYQSGEGELLGASTISMQTAKNVFLWPARDWLRKAFEAYFTGLIELAWRKRRIIEVYLNVAEWGRAFTARKPRPNFISTNPRHGSGRQRRRGSPPCCRTRSIARQAVPTRMSPSAAPSCCGRCRTCRSRRRCPAVVRSDPPVAPPFQSPL